GPLRPSTGCVATNNRTLGGKLSTLRFAPAPRAAGPARPHPPNLVRTAHVPRAARSRFSAACSVAPQRTLGPVPARSPTVSANDTGAPHRGPRVPQTAARKVLTLSAWPVQRLRSEEHTSELQSRE